MENQAELQRKRNKKHGEKRVREYYKQKGIFDYIQLMKLRNECFKRDTPATTSHPECKLTGAQTTKYHLYGTIVHAGSSANCGHYYACVRSGRSTTGSRSPNSSKALRMTP